MTRLRSLIVLIVFACLIWAEPVRADAVVDWNDIALQAITTAINAGRPGLVTGLDLAMVHAAVYDAVQAIDRRFEPYHVEIPRASGSPAAAAAKAAHDVLVNRFPEQATSLAMTYHRLPGQQSPEGRRPRGGSRPEGRCRYHRPAGQ